MIEAMTHAVKKACYICAAAILLAGSGWLLAPAHAEETPAPSDEQGSSTPLEGVKIRWGMNDESSSASFNPGTCNFLSAGTSGSKGSSAVWTEADGLYSSQDGHVRIVKADSNGGWTQASWATRCLDRNGRQVGLQPIGWTTQSEVEISEGKGEVRSDGSLRVSWTGSWTVVYYGGMTYWSAKNPVLTLDAQGNGTLRAVASGYGADRENTQEWKAIPEQEITLAQLRGVDMSAARRAGGFSHTPEYVGVAIRTPNGSEAQAPRTEQNKDFWGSFPQDFVDFQGLTGQGSYWYSSNGQRDRAKVASPVNVSFSSAFTLPPAQNEGNLSAPQPKDEADPAQSAPPVPPSETIPSDAQMKENEGAAHNPPNNAEARSQNFRQNKEKPVNPAQQSSQKTRNAEEAQSDKTLGSEEAKKKKTSEPAREKRNETSALRAPEPWKDTPGRIALGAGTLSVASALPVLLGVLVKRRLAL
ncbi:hypothetical protein [Schaalia sp. lx-100]|uniref:hypothetical protein n=1 Tax=Schaalia sp. lx-100 TaxID=2899081 RepID=UPI001E3B5763|nr:hypothetical protein [Schaalia sp. lx-100]MCD4557211.1 hypothetical protein [Schaalia sp. lx-100]